MIRLLRAARLSLLWLAVYGLLYGAERCLPARRRATVTAVVVVAVAVVAVTWIWGTS